MPPSLDQLRSFLRARPHDPFLKYAIAIELKNSGATAEARAAFETLAQEHPHYVPTYYHWGQALEFLGEQEEALSVYRRGIETATRAGDAHAASELQRALSALQDLL